MGLVTGIRKEVGMTPKTILVAPENAVSLSVFCNNTGVTAVNGAKIIAKGTPLTGDLQNRAAAFAVASTTNNASNAVGIALTDMNVTAGDANGNICIEGTIDMKKLDANTAALITDEVKEALKGSVHFVK